jgi:hypothetical protein
VNKYLKFFLLSIAVWFDTTRAFGQGLPFRHSSPGLNYFDKTRTAAGISIASEYSVRNVSFLDVSGINIEVKAPVAPVSQII